MASETMALLLLALPHALPCPFAGVDCSCTGSCGCGTTTGGGKLRSTMARHASESEASEPEVKQDHRAPFSASAFHPYDLPSVELVVNGEATQPGRTYYRQPDGAVPHHRPDFAERAIETGVVAVGPETERGYFLRARLDPGNDGLCDRPRHQLSRHSARKGRSHRAEKKCNFRLVSV